MTARCGGGASNNKPGVAAHVVFSAGLITEGLGLISPWLLPVALLIDAFVYQATSNCATDPPAMPTSADLSIENAIGGVLNPNFGAWLTAVNNLLLNWAWDQFCTCASGSPTAVVYPSAPAGVTQPVSSGTPPCYQGSIQTTMAREPAFNYTSQGNYPSAFPNNGVVYTDTSGSFPVDFVQLSVVPQQVQLSAAFTGLTVGRSYACQLAFQNAAKTYLSLPQPLSVFNASTTTWAITETLAVPATAVWAHLVLDDLSGTTSGGSVTVTLNWQCSGGAPGTPGSPCADTTQLMGALSQLLQLVNAIYAGLPVPLNSYAESTVHSGLTGSGSFAVAAGCLAVKVTFTAPGYLGRSAGDPVEYFDAGWITTSLVEGGYRPNRLEQTPQLVVMGVLADTVHYTLSAGVTAAITELVAGP